MTKKRTLLLISLTAFALILFIFYRVMKKDEIIIIRENHPFRKDGELFFLAENRFDTLVNIDIEIARDQEAINRGLMNRDLLPPDAGMLFIFPSAELRTFWMKNTRIPLDILFIGENMEILYVIHHATPYLTDPLPGFHPSGFVVEVNAGFCRKNEIKEGQFIQFKNL